VNKLKACGRLDSDLLHTVNGREYVTQKRLRQDIARQLQLAGGRIAVSSPCGAARASATPSPCAALPLRRCAAAPPPPPPAAAAPPLRRHPPCTL
jgi:hypothetical protein